MSTPHNIVIEFLSRFKDTGVRACVAAMSRVAGVVKKSTHILAVMGSSLGDLGGKLGKVASDAEKFTSAFMALGSIGAVIAGAQIIIDKIAQHYQKVCDEMVDAVRIAGEKISAYLQRQKSERMEAVAAALKEAGVEAERTARSFETLAAAYKQIGAAKSDRQTAENSAAEKALENEKRSRVRDADDDEKGVVGAEYDAKIAAQRSKSVGDRASAEIDVASKDVKDATERVVLALEKERLAREALAKASEVAAEFKDIDAAETKKAEADREAAEAALFAAADARARAETALIVAEEKVGAIRTRAEADVAAALSAEADAIKVAAKARVDFEKERAMRSAESEIADMVGNRREESAAFAAIWNARKKSDAKAGPVKVDAKADPVKVDAKADPVEVELDPAKYIALYDEKIKAGASAADALAQVQARIKGDLEDIAAAERERARASKLHAKRMAALDRDIEAKGKDLAELEIIQANVARAIAADRKGHEFKTDENGNINNVADFRRAERNFRDVRREDARRTRDGELDEKKAKGLERRLRRGFGLNNTEVEWLKKFREMKNQQRDANKIKVEIEQKRKEKDAEEARFRKNIQEIRDALVEATKI